MDNNRIRPVLKDKKGNIWVGTEGGHIGKLDAEQTTGGGRLFTYYKIQDKLFAKGQRSLIQDKKGNIWIGTTGSGIIKYDGINFINYALGTGMATQSIFDTKEDKKGNIWFGTRDGSIVMYNGENFILYTIKGGLPGTIIYSILEDKKGNLWFCTEEGGIYKYDGETFIIYAAKEGLFNKSITSITEDDKGNIWLGTLGAGVCKFDGKNFIYYSTAQGLADNNVWSVFCDSAKHLWFGTDKGLTLFVPQKDTLEETKTNYSIYNFGLQDGLKALDFNLHSFCVDNNNHIWWGTGKNSPSFDLNKEFHADSLRSLKLSHIEINERVYDFRNFTAANENKIRFSNVLPFSSYPENLSLPYDQNYLTFHFSAIDWSAPHKIKYRYRLMGLDEKWSKPSEEPKVNYRNLSHGSYKFQLKAIGRSQEWTTAFTYSFVVRPAWWQTWWFKLFIILVAVALLLFVSRLIYLSRLRKQKVLMEKELAVQLERQRISAEMHDDIGAGLSGVRLLTEITRSKIKDTDASKEMDKIYESVGEISAKMKEVIWSLNTENDDIASLIAFIQKQTRAMLEYYPCELQIDIPSSFPSIDISGEARRNIYLTVKEVLHNIIKHSGADKIKLSITCSEKLVITISDNGKGFSSVANSGNGLKNMKQRMDKLNGSILIQSIEGTTIILEIPLKTNI